MAKPLPSGVPLPSPFKKMARATEVPEDPILWAREQAALLPRAPLPFLEVDHAYLVVPLGPGETRLMVAVMPFRFTHERPVFAVGATQEARQAVCDAIRRQIPSYATVISVEIAKTTWLPPCMRSILELAPLLVWMCLASLPVSPTRKLQQSLTCWWSSSLCCPMSLLETMLYP